MAKGHFLNRKCVYDASTYVLKWLILIGFLGFLRYSTELDEYWYSERIKKFYVMLKWRGTPLMIFAALSRSCCHDLNCVWQSHMVNIPFQKRLERCSPKYICNLHFDLEHDRTFFQHHVKTKNVYIINFPFI